MTDIQIPAKMVPVLFEPHRYKVFKGGRGSAKSWGVARGLLALTLSKPLRVLCTREVQKSIADSSYKLLADQIRMLGLESEFEVLKSEIRGRNGSEFIFRGLGNMTAESIKSMEGVDIVWAEEAHTISDRSWELLIPTIRKEGSEVWVTYNPDSPEDPVDRRFVQNPPPGCAVVAMNWNDNPWFPSVLKTEKDYLYSVDPETAEHVWAGAYRRVSDAQILRGRWTVHEFAPVPGLWDGPYHGIDFGFSQDQGTMVRVWIWEGDLWLEYEAAGLEVDTDDLPALWDTIPEARNYLARADNSRPETISAVKRAGFNRVVACQKWKGCEEDGIAHIKSYKAIHIHPRCALAIEEAKNWSWKKDRLTGDILPVTTGKFDNTWAAVRYALEPVILHGLKKRKEEPEEEFPGMRRGYTGQGWMA